MSLLNELRPLKSPMCARDLTSPLKLRTARKSAIDAGRARVSCTNFLHFAPQNRDFAMYGDDFYIKIPIFDEKTQKNLVMSKKSCTFAPAFEKKLHGGLSSVGRASDCGSECQGFEPLIPPA